MRVMIADDQAMVRSALKLILGQDAECEVVFECEDGRELADAVRTHRPDVLLLDWELNHLEACETLLRVRQLRPSLAIVALSSRPQARHSALMCGADDFVNKGDPPEHLLSVIEKHCNLRTMPSV